MTTEIYNGMTVNNLFSNIDMPMMQIMPKMAMMQNMNMMSMMTMMMRG